jgi:uncharacterized delta-60 repeat protein
VASVPGPKPTSIPLLRGVATSELEAHVPNFSVFYEIVSQLTNIERNQGKMMRKHILRTMLIVALLTIVCASVPAAQATPTLAAPGELDPTFAGFGAGGKVTLTGPNMVGGTGGMALAPDGKIVMVGYNNTHLLVWRYLPSGQPDPSFGNAGLYAYAPADFDTIPTDVAVRPDGKIVIVGRTTEGIDYNNGDFLVMQVLADGSNLDVSFNGNGYVVTDFAGKGDWAEAVLIQPDGKIVACGAARVGSNDNFAVARYLPDGTPDTTFSDDGKTTIGFGYVAIAYAIARQNDGKLVLAGVTRSFFALLRLTDTGMPDTSFDGDGRVTTDFGDILSNTAYAVTIQPNDGKIIALGNNGNNRGLIARYESDGALDDNSDGDGGFASVGKIRLDRGTGHLYDLALQPDGKILALGQTDSGLGNFVFYRFDAYGVDDPTFGTNGRSEVGFGATEVGTDLALLPDGRILSFGLLLEPNTASFTRLGLARLWPNGTLDTGGQQTHGLAFPPGYQPGFRETANDMALQPDGAFLVAGQLFALDNTFSDAFVTRFTPGGLPDPSFGTNGSADLSGPGLFNAATAVAVQSDGKIVIAGYSAFNPAYTIRDFLVVRLHPNGAPDMSFGSNGYKLVDFPADGADSATALALAPDGKIVVAGSVWTGTTYTWGVVRLTSAGQLDSTFGIDGRVVNLSGNNAGANAVVVQGDGKIIIGGSYNNDFFLQRLLDNGWLDGNFGANSGGYTLTDLGGTDIIAALALAPNGWIYAAGYRINNTNTDMALAQYTPAGLLASCPSGEPCDHWPNGTFFLDAGNEDYAFALDLRSDNQLVAAGCSNDHFAGVQVRTDGAPTPLLFNTDFAGYPDCANAVKFSGPNTILMAGGQDLYPSSSDWNIDLARFQTTKDATRLDQTISFPPLSDRQTGEAPFDLSASTSSGLPLSFSFTSTPLGVCQVAGKRVTIGQVAGTCTITAEQAGDATYNPAPSVSQSFLVRDPARRDQTISFLPLSDRLLSETVTLSATASSGLPVQFRSSTPAVCTLQSATSLGLLKSGICTVIASQTGNAQYNPAREVARSFAVRDPAKKEQTISVQPTPLPQQLPRGQPLTLRATASSGLAVEIASATPATCTVIGATVVGQAAGMCTISLSQTGDAHYNPVRLELRFTITAPASPGERIWLPLVQT